MKPIVEKEFKVGDKIIVTPHFGAKHTLTVTRITKSHAVCEKKNLAGQKVVYKFKKTWRTDGSWFSVQPVPIPVWPTDTYEVIES